jgi:hypothetical protein
LSLAKQGKLIVEHLGIAAVVTRIADPFDRRFAAVGMASEGIALAA